MAEVEPTVTEPTPGAAPGEASPPAPATPPQAAPAAKSPAAADVDLEHPAVKAAIEREAQRKKDKEIAAALRKQGETFKQREAAIRQAAKKRLTDAGDKEAEQWDGAIDMASEIAEYQAWKASAQIAAQKCEPFGISPSDSRLLGCATWEEFDEKLRKAYAEDLRNEHEKAEAQVAEKKKQEANSAVASGNLSTLLTAPGGAVPPAGELDKFTVKDAKALYALGLKKMSEAKKGRK